MEAMVLVAVQRGELVLFERLRMKAGRRRRVDRRLRMRVVRGEMVMRGQAAGHGGGGRRRVMSVVLAERVEVIRRVQRIVTE